MDKHIIVIMAAAAWMLGCTIAAHYTRDRSDKGDFPTARSEFFKWACVIGPVVIMGVDLILAGLLGKR